MDVTQAPGAYRLLFGRATAAVLVLAAASALALSQTRVWRDWLAALHPAWPEWAWWLAASGAELSILATGLVLARTGRRGLWAWEIGLVLASLAIGYDVSCQCLAPLARHIIGGAMALQYLAVVQAGYYLAVTTRAPRTAPARVQAQPAPPSGRKARASTKPPPPADWHRQAAAVLASGGTQADAARAASVAESTVMRAMRAGRLEMEVGG